ncbi:MAG: YfiM family protein [candidate division KSB1 bacterium]|nr:YfiM family protein [candidate division KSB1 bacterium]MDZ7364324.1 YfiM family protein [candidate division KSB1 bacterium]MDZ7402696.1 YfiM family protein [candidate division KSB1 bacterium]
MHFFLEHMFKPSFAGTPVGSRSTSKRRRRRQRDFSKKGKKRNQSLVHCQAAPAALHLQRTSFTSMPVLGWKGIWAALGIFSLLGAGPLNRSDELVWLMENFSRHCGAHAGKRNEARLFSSFTGTPSSSWRAENFLKETAPIRSRQPGALPHSSESTRTTVQKRFEQSFFRTGQAIEPEKTLSGPVAAQWASLESPRLPHRTFPPDLIASDPRLGRMAFMMWPASSSPVRRPGLRWERLALVQTGSLGMTVFGFRKMDEFFGRGQRSFRAGNDWTSDRTLHFDELLHFQGGYRITQGLIEMYRWAGLNATWAECLGAGTAASVMTYLEYVDGRRPKPKQGASYSDFTANLLGVGFALAKQHVAMLQDVDLRLNYTSFGDVLHKKTLLKYDRMTHWLTYDLKRQWNVPLHVGIGYGVQNSFKPNVRSEIYLGVGLTPVDILERYYPAAAKPLAWLSMYHFGWQVQIK